MCEQDRAPPAHRLSAEAKKLTWTSDLPKNCVLTLTAMHQERQTLHHQSLSSHHQVSTPTVVEPALISVLWLQRVTLSRRPGVPPGFANTSASRLPSPFCGRDGTCQGWPAEPGMGLTEDPIRQGGLLRWPLVEDPGGHLELLLCRSVLGKPSGLVPPCRQCQAAEDAPGLGSPGPSAAFAG